MSKVYYKVHMTCVLHNASNVLILTGTQNYFLCPTLVTRQKTYSSISLPSSKLTISFIHYKHDAIDNADPSSMQDVCHVNFVIDLTYCRVSVAQW